MRKLLLNLAVSLDGFIEDANGAYDWCFTDQDYGMTAFMKRIDTILFGRKSYELVQKEGAGYYKAYKQVVFSSTMKSSTANGITVINEDAAGKLQAMKNETGKDIWLFGGASLVSTFMNAGLVDELMLSVHPVILGGGKPLFGEIRQRTTLHLTGTKNFDTGLVQLYYDVLS